MRAAIIFLTFVSVVLGKTFHIETKDSGDDYHEGSGEDYQGKTVIPLPDEDFGKYVKHLQHKFSSQSHK